MLLIESALMLALLLLAFAAPRTASSSFFGPIERALSRLAQKRGLAVLVVGAAALALRAAMLPILPIPRPAVQDEFSYLLMADTFAHWRLTNPMHPLWTHFESLLVIQHPTYCSMYYPAQGFFLALAQMLRLHPFWGVWLSVGLMCAAICWMLQAWVPPLWALIGGLLAAIRLGAFSYWANSYWGGATAAIGGALVLGALPRMRRSPRTLDALLMGFGFALVANSRPYEGLFFGIPIFAALIIWLFRRTGHNLKFKFSRAIVPLSAVLVLTVGFMLYYFWRTTGNPLLPPYVVNFRTYSIDPGFSFLPLRAEPAYHNEAIRRHYVEWTLTQYQFARAHPFFAAAIKLLMMWFFFLGPLLTLPFLALAFALPYGTSFNDVPRKTRFLLVVCGFTLFAMLIAVPANPHYAAPLTAAIYVLLIMAMQRVRRWRVQGRLSGVFLARAVPTAAFALLVIRVAIPVFHLKITNASAPLTWCSPWTESYPRSEIQLRMEALPGRQLVLVRYGPDHDSNATWVNNPADIDNAKVVWAHDQGQEKNQELLRYFPDRQVWWLDPKQNAIELREYAPTQEALR